MAEDEDIRRARLYRQQIAAAKPVAADADPLAALQKSIAESKVVDPYTVRGKVSGLSPAQIEANKNISETAKLLGTRIIPGAKGDDATADRLTPFVVKKSTSPTGPTGPGLTGPTGPTGPTGTPTGPTGVTTYTAPDGRIFTDLNAYNAYITKLKADEKAKEGQSAYDLLFAEFNRYGLGGLIEPLKGFIAEGLSQAEFTLRLRETDAYKKRFAANAQRIQKGLRALSEAQYIELEDQYQDVMRRYGLPESYYTRGDMGRQEGFEKFIGGDVSPVELEDRIQTAQRRVLNAAPQIKNALTQYYGDEISNGDILAYVLDPAKAIENIKRKVTAAEIGGGAAIAGLGATRARAEELGAFGVTGEQARVGYQTIGEFLPRASQLGDIYAKQGMGPFTQTTAEEEVFGTTGAVEAGKKRRKLAQLEQAQFSGTSGATGGALSRERAGQY